MRRNVRTLITRRWNLPALAYRAAVRATLIAGGLVGVLVAAPFVALFAATLGAIFIIGSLRASLRLRRYASTSAGPGAAAAGGTAASGPRAHLPGSSLAPGTSGRRSGALVAKPRPGRRLPLRNPDWRADRGPVLEAIDFKRSIEAMARHGWTRADVMRQLEGLGACWLWSGPADGRVRGTEVYLEHRQGPQLLYRWFAPPVEIKLTFDADGRLLHGAADRMKMRM